MVQVAAPPLTTVPPPPSRCKVCGARAPLFDVVDFSKSCADPSGAPFAPSGRDVAYHRCARCGFIFTHFFDAFTPEDFRREVYNDGYVLVDPLYPALRPEANGRLLRRVLAEACAFSASPRLLDYGAGSGALAAALGDAALTHGYDPFSMAAHAPPAGAFDVVFSSEVIEHVTAPSRALAAMRGYLRGGGFMLLSTAVPPADIDTQRGGWWYLSPRNGHVCAFTHDALARLCKGAGLQYTALSGEWHLMELLGAPCAALDTDRLRGIVAALPTGFVDVTAR